MDKQSKLVEFQPNIYQGQHRSWQNRDGKTNWEFAVKFENGDKGVVSKQSQNPVFKPGELYHYDIKEQTFDWGTVFKVSNMKTEEQQTKQQSFQGGQKKGYNMTPEKQKQIMCQVSMIAANSIMNKLSEDYDTIVREFLSFLILNAPHHDPISLQGALKIAAEYWNRVPTEGVTISSVLQTTKDNIIKTEKSSQWDGTLQTSTNKSLEEQPPSHQNDQLDQKPETTGEDPFIRIV